MELLFPEISIRHLRQMDSDKSKEEENKQSSEVFKPE